MVNPWEFPTEENWEEPEEPEIDQKANEFGDAERRLEDLLNGKNSDDTLSKILEEMQDPLSIKTIKKSRGAVSKEHLEEIEKIVRKAEKKGGAGKAS